MGIKLLTIKTGNQYAYDKVLSNWLNAGATILQCGYASDEEGGWWAIATIDGAVKEKPCDIPERVAKRGSSVPDAYWPWGDEEEHTFYYDFVMFEEDQDA